jgi:NADH-quinone oxidoreductase subunit H
MILLADQATLSEAPVIWTSLEGLPQLPNRLVEWICFQLGAPEWLVVLAGFTVSAAVVVGVFLTCFALVSLVERKTLARIQNRYGPNRVGPFGILQPVADGIKMLTKEDIVPYKADKVLHLLAPIMIVVPAVLALAVLPYGKEWIPVDLRLGLAFFFAVGAMTEMSVFIAGWASGSKFPMLGSLRAISQMVSYELPLMLSAMGVIMMTGSLSLPAIVEHQSTYNLGFISNWNIFTPWGLVAGIVFFIACIAEANRCPFDLPEGESEIVAGHMTEYSGFKYALFFMGEYLGLFAISGLFITLFLGGWSAPVAGLEWVPTWLWFFAKLVMVIMTMLWIRGTFMRVRMDQLMRFCWLFLIPLSLLTIPAAAVWKYSGEGILGWLITMPFLLIPWVIITVILNRRMAPATRQYHFAE